MTRASALPARIMRGTRSGALFYHNYCYIVVRLVGAKAGSAEVARRNLCGSRGSLPERTAGLHTPQLRATRWASHPSRPSTWSMSVRCQCPVAGADGTNTAEERQ